ncbi:MAG: nickel pincer cofactor biosynthesis protein LarC [Deltaproteobacteria bacterium]|nr:nickel pincer cofactor biosynthesis protein LarC [Deltaproteobacteria bacterium]
MRVLYFDSPSGISGDMTMAALIDLGVDIKKIKRELKKLGLSNYTIKTTLERRHAIEGVRFKVRTTESKHHRTFKDIKKIIEKSKLAKEVKVLSIEIFKTLAIAEGSVHGISAEKVHFHEVGAVDSIVDIVGVAIAIIDLKVDAIYSSPIPLGSGLVSTMHGTMPIPAPATIELMRGIPTKPSPVAMELTTPTGAVIAKTLVKEFGPMPAMVIEKIGYGVGGKDFEEIPNILRVVLGEMTATPESDSQSAIVLETNIDDMTPEIGGYLIERLLKEGALDAYITPVQMKKTRMGMLITVITEEKLKDSLLEVIFTESTSIGVRSYRVERDCLAREIKMIKTPYGKVGVKLSYLNGRLVNSAPEYEDCKLLAEKKGIALKEIMDSARESLRSRTQVKEKTRK